MKRLTTRTVLSLTLVLVGACSSDPTDTLRNGVDHLIASPSQLFVEPGGTKKVVVGAVDDQGNAIAETYVITAVGSGLSVTRDSTFETVFVSDTQQTVPERAPQFRFNVTAAPFDPSISSFPATSFTITAAGKSIDVPVQVAPVATLDVTFSTTTPAIGETVTMTAPTGITFTPDATLAFVGGALQPVILAQDATTITFLLPPNSGGPLKVSGVLSPSAPGTVLEPLTTTSLTSPLVDTLDVVFSTTAPAIGGTVNVTISNPLLKFKPCTLPGVPGCVAPVTPGDTTFAPHLAFPNEVALPTAVTVSVDSNTLSFQAPPNAAGPGKIDSIIFPGGYALSLPSRTSVTAPSIGTTVAVTFSNNNPAIGDFITATAPANFHFGTNVALTFGARLAALTSISADSTQATFVALPGLSGPATISDLKYAPASQFSVTLPTVQTITVPNLTPLLGTDDPKTAPSLTLPAPGGTTTLFDAGPFNGPPEQVVGDLTRLYKVVLPVPATLTFTFEWFQGQFLFFVLTSDPADPNAVINTSDFDEVSPETLTVALPAGTFFLQLADDNGPPNPDLFKITLQRAP